MSLSNLYYDICHSPTAAETQQLLGTGTSVSASYGWSILMSTDSACSSVLWPFNHKLHKIIYLSRNYSPNQQITNSSSFSLLSNIVLLRWSWLNSNFRASTSTECSASSNSNSCSLTIQAILHYNLQQGIHRHQDSAPVSQRREVRYTSRAESVLAHIWPTTAKRGVIHKTGITSRIAMPPEEDRATAKEDLHKKICEDWSSGSRYMLTDRQTDRQTDRRVDDNTLHPTGMQ